MGTVLPLPGLLRGLCSYTSSRLCAQIEPKILSRTKSHLQEIHTLFAIGWQPTGSSKCRPKIDFTGIS